MKRIIIASFVVLFALSIAAPANAQFGGLKKLAGKVKEAIPDKIQIGDDKSDNGNIDTLGSALDEPTPAAAKQAPTGTSGRAYTPTKWNLKDGQPALIKITAPADLVLSQTKSFLNDKFALVDVDGQRITTEWGAEHKCPGFTVAKCQERAVVEVQENGGITTVRLSVVQRARDISKDNYAGDKGVKSKPTEELATELERMLFTQKATGTN